MNENIKTDNSTETVSPIWLPTAPPPPHQADDDSTFDTKVQRVGEFTIRWKYIQAKIPKDCLLTNSFHLAHEEKPGDALKRIEQQSFGPCQI